jgi:ABC-type phosphate transport system substrate-binding protein
MRNVRLLAATASAAAVTLGVLGLAVPAAQAQPHVAAAATKYVPAGPATFVAVTSCASGTKASFGSSSPALPDGSTGAVFPKVNKNGMKLVGAWPGPATGTSGAPTKYVVTEDCSNGKTVVTDVKVQPEPVDSAAVGEGAQTQQSLVDQFSGDYNATLTSNSDTHLYNWDAVDPDNGQTDASTPPSTIIPKQGCSSIDRPDGSSQGITALAASQVVNGVNCLNFANSSRPRGSGDPIFGKGGVAFVALAGDAVSWSHESTTDAPKSLTVSQLNAIYSCTDTNWDQVGGKNAPIKAFEPQPGSGTLSFFLAAIGVTTPGSCVSNDNNLLEENEGVNPVLQSPEAIFFYSAGDWIAQKYHSAKCTNSGCTATPPCSPATGKNEFGCNLTGKMVEGEIDGVAPITGTGSSAKINTAFDSSFDRTLYTVVPYDPNTTDFIPGSESGAPGGVDLEKIVGASGWACTSATAKTDIKNYGFQSIPTCGATS